MNSKVIKFAVIGCGRIAGHHCRAIKKTDGAELVAVCDLNIEKANIYKDEFGVKSYVNYHDMLLSNPEIDAVVIATPSGMHYHHALDIIDRYSKSLIVEKPTFMNPSQVNEVYSKALRMGVQIFPVFQNRHNLAVQRVIKGLQTDELGKVRTASVRVRWCRSQRYYDLAPWRGTYSMDGGSLTNQGVHHVDLLRTLGGEIEAVCGVFGTFGAQIEVEDTAVAAYSFKNGGVGTLEITTSARPIDYEASLSLVCDKGLAQIGGIAVNELQVYTPDPEACKTYSEDFSGNVYGHGHEKIYAEVVACLTSGKIFSVNHHDALSTVKLLNSFYVAAQSRSWVNLSEVPDSGSRLGESNRVLEEMYTAPLIS